MAGAQFIELEGVRVNNLRGISLKLRHNALTVICGVSGSGKSSLAFDTLYAEGQRRYVETFSPSARQLFDRIERPSADRISGLPPAIAIRQQMRADGPRSTLGTRTEILDSLRILFARGGRLVCTDCDVTVDAMSAEAAAADVADRFPGARLMIAASVSDLKLNTAELVARLLHQGFTRAVLDGRIVRLAEVALTAFASELLVIVDRLQSISPVAGPHPGRATLAAAAITRLAAAISNAMQLTDGRCVVLVDSNSLDPDGAELRGASVPQSVSIEGVDWLSTTYSNRRLCSQCKREFPEPSPELLNFSSPLGACPECEGTGLMPGAVIPGRRKAAPLRGPAVVCPSCAGSRMNGDADAVRFGGCSLPDAAAMEVSDLTTWLTESFSALSNTLQQALRPALEHAQKRLKFLVECGMSHLSLDRSIKTLSGGEAQRALLTTALGSGLINTLYVLDEPTSGLHSTDTERIIAAARRLQQTGNTVVVVEHDPTFILAADEVIEIGPGAGDNGGIVVFQGTPHELLTSTSATGGKLRDCQAEPAQCLSADAVRIPEHWIELTGVHCHNLDGLNVKLPLGVFCAITGVSGSGKSSLIVDALYPALSRALGMPFAFSDDCTVEAIDGISQIDSVLLLDQSPVPRSRRSIPATWIGVFDDIRVLFAETHEAKKRNYSRAMFSFNASSGGRCPVCEGRGVITVAMQFLADIETTCEECSGRRFRPEVIDIRYRDRSIHDILRMTTDEAFMFFNGHHRLQQRFNAVRQVGLGYLRLGQPLSSISGGEAQRLRIAALLAGIPLTNGEASPQNRKAAQLTRAGRTLFLLDEPSSGLHLLDIDRLLSCIDFLLQTGHSVIVIDHDPALTSRADWIVEMGPGPGRFGGQIVNFRQGDRTSTTTRCDEPERH